ncbi:putative histidine kinase HHK1p [Xylariaceae sp. FL1019]|nr:putative histidine kinase HHK1p [Xylariaceae sp. FL1019]
MDNPVAMLDEHDPPPRILERLRQIAGYSWDESTNRPFHSSYDNWQFYGTRFVSLQTDNTPTPASQYLSSPPTSLSSSRILSAGAGDFITSPGPKSDHGSDRVNSSPSGLGLSPASDQPVNIEPQEVVARISYHPLREERAYQTARNIVATADPDGEHIARPLDLIRLTPQPGDRGPVIVSIYESLGPNYLTRALDLGPAFYYAVKVGDRLEAHRRDDFRLDPPISLAHFLDFAIGAAQCLELLHHRHGTAHGEIRADAFHYNMELGQVKLIKFGSGVRSFEHGLTSTGWSTLSKELGAKNKLAYISPEQTGRMPAEPDTRTDIYSLGVLFWMLLTQQPVFTGATPLDIVQCVLSRRIPIVSNIRNDVPESIGRIIQKCTSKNTSERYNSASGLRHDLQDIRRLLEVGDQEALRLWTVASKDVSSYFMLPTVMIGRDQEQLAVLKVVERVARSHPSRQSKSPTYLESLTLSSNSLATADVSSDRSSSLEGVVVHGSSFMPASDTDVERIRGKDQSPDGADAHMTSGDASSVTSTSSPYRSSKPSDRHLSISTGAGNKNSVDSFSERQASRVTPSEAASSNFSRQLGSAKYKRRGYCEIVTIEGAGGLGKSFLVQQVLADARKRGYCASAKFDTARRTAFGALLKLVASLFRQVWGERNTDTTLHQALRDYVGPMWPSLHKVLGLPEFLFGPPEQALNRSLSTATNSSGGQFTRLPVMRSNSSGSSPSLPRAKSPRIVAQSSEDYVRTGASTATIRLLHTFLDILRIFTTHHVICLCLDDLQFADDESLDLITQVVSARLKMVLIVTYRPEELAPERLHKILHPAENEETSMNGSSRVTKITLSPLTENEIVQYIAFTLGMSTDEVAPLALIVQSKTAGNPFYMREMLSACYRQKCIWFDYRANRWMYDLDRLFVQFRSEHGYDALDSDFMSRRLKELPPASRWILAWAALLGNSFSFELVCQLMSGELGVIYDEFTEAENTQQRAVFSKEEAVAGLQAAVSACIIIQGETDNRFRFAHDRYLQAAASLNECNNQSMHFVIAQTLMSKFGHTLNAKDTTASHICESVDMIKQRIPDRYPYRKHLMDCAATAVENGAKPTAVKYYRHAVQLLQPDSWTEGNNDVHYDETLQLHLRAAECYVSMGNHEAARHFTDAIFDNARSADDRATACLLHSRIQFQSGNAISALNILKQSLQQLEVPFDSQPTLESCDEAFMQLCTRIQTLGRAQTVNPSNADQAKQMSAGVILSDAVQAAWWSSDIDFYNLSIALMNMHLREGPMPQSSMAFLYLAMIAITRFNMIQFAAELGTQFTELLERFKDPASFARGSMAFAAFISHIQTPLCVTVSQCDELVYYAASAGDRASIILTYGLSVQLKFFASENVIDLEGVCQYCCEEVDGWQQDTRGGTFLISVRQLCRALQGKTRIKDETGVMSDDKHDSESYKSWLLQNTSNGDRSALFYETMEIIPLYLYGHHEKACELGRRCMDKLDLIWSIRNTRIVMAFYGLTLSGLLLRRLVDPRTDASELQHEVQETITQINQLNDKIKAWQVASNVNYLAWSKFLDAQVAELRGEHGAAIRQYEAALDHASEYNFTFEEALGNYLMAGFFIRQAARRSAMAVLKESVSLWRQIGALGVAHCIEEDHVLLLHGPTPSHRTADAAVQTDFAGDSATIAYTANGEDVHQTPHPAIEETKATRMAAWRGSTTQTEVGAGLPALDMIDLHAILVSSQVISSVLQIDVLLKTMCDVILQTCGGSVTQAAIIVQDDDDKNKKSSWCIAASGDPEKGAIAHTPGRSLAGTSRVAENVVLYCTRFREVVFTSDILSDERFSNVAVSWSQRNPQSKAIVAMPICHGSKPLLGVLYLEGQPGSFTDRIVTVLQLLVNQIGISYSNALAMKGLEKASKENDTMIEMQRRALTNAIEAEAKAKVAEAEANRNVKLAEEAAKAKNIFLANVSHELRTPLNGVIGNSELLRDSPLGKDQLEMADSIRVSADLLLTVINDILDFSKMEADKMKLYIIAFNPEEMVREVVRAVSYSNREKASKKNVKIVQDINLPSMLIYGDPTRLHQVLGNLIGNSLKFTEDGSITIGARVESETNEQATLTFWVQDTGVGIPSKQLAKLFKPFSQADASTARKYGGSGLGLSICKSLIETMMKGQIELDSQEDIGTTVWFTVTFDKAKAEVSAGDVQDNATPPTPEQIRDVPQLGTQHTAKESVSSLKVDLTVVPKDQLRICIAEDNIINQKIAIQYVRKLGYKHVDAYDNGQKAIEGLRQKAQEGIPYHVILMDVQMPVLDGYDATKLLRQDPIEEIRSILVIAMTASAIQGDREKCLAAGMNDYLAKPVKADILQRKLDTYTSRPANRPAQQAPSPPTITGQELTGNSPPLLLPKKDTPLENTSQETLKIPRRTSSEAATGSNKNLAPTEASDVPQSQSAKRQPRKLLKSRQNSEGLGSLTPGDKPKSVLTKRSLRPNIAPLGGDETQSSEERISTRNDTPLTTPPLSTASTKSVHPFSN